MGAEIKLWHIADDTLKPIDSSGLDLESRLEEWLRKDVGLVNDDLLVIGKQVATAHTGSIDLLAMDADGNLVILELKKGKTPRDVVAQTLDYASWVKTLGHEEVGRIAAKFLGGDATLEQAFMDKFGANLPEVVNERHRMYIVASAPDPSTERILEYLSETYGVDINFASFNYFKTDNGLELVGRSMLIDEEVAQARAATGSGRRRGPKATEAELREIAYNNGVRDLWDKALDENSGLRNLVHTTNTSQSTLTLQVRFASGSRPKSVISLIPRWSYPENGLVIRLLPDAISEYFGVSENEIVSVFGHAIESIPGVDTSGGGVMGLWACRLFDADRLDNLIKFIADAKDAKDRAN